MASFSPFGEIINGEKILETYGNWPSFYECHIISLTYKRGNYIQDPGLFDEPTIDASIDFSYHEPPFIVDLRFHRCSSVSMSYFNSENVIENLSIAIEQRGFYADGTTPLPSYICVQIGTQNHTVFTSFKCFQVEVLGKIEATGETYP